MTIVWVMLGSALGAPTRYLLDRFVQTRHERVFPWGTWVINVSGSFTLGLLTGLVDHQLGGAESWLVPVVGVGFLGGYTTFSTFTWETLRLAEDGAVLPAAANVVGSTTAGLAAAALGLLLGSA